MIPITPKGTTTSLLYIWATPGASSNRLGEIILATDEQRPYLKVYVTAPPEKGAANKAIINLLSKKLGVPKSNFGLLHGLSDRKKTFEVESNADELIASLKLATSSLF